MTTSFNHLDVMTAKISTSVTYGTSVGTGILAWIGTNHFAVITSFIIGLLAFLISTYLKFQERKERKIRHDLDVKERLARIDMLNRRHSVPPGIPEESESTY